LTRAEALLLSTPPEQQYFARHHHQLGRIAEIKGDYQRAEEHYGQAVKSDSTATEWRYRYALVLEKTGQRSEAASQINLCLLQDPHNRAYEKKRLELADHATQLPK
jgi:tetratricopeptide (TPR) repeat protein